MQQQADSTHLLHAIVIGSHRPQARLPMVCLLCAQVFFHENRYGQGRVGCQHHAPGLGPVLKSLSCASRAMRGQTSTRYKAPHATTTSGTPHGPGSVPCQLHFEVTQRQEHARCLMHWFPCAREYRAIAREQSVHGATNCSMESWQHAQSLSSLKSLKTHLVESKDTSLRLIGAQTVAKRVM